MMETKQVFRTRKALSGTPDITAYDGEKRTGCPRILTDGHCFGTGTGFYRSGAKAERPSCGLFAEGESEAQMIRSETDKEVEIMLYEAEAQAEILTAEGEAEYMRILSAAYSDGERAAFYEFVRGLDAAKSSLTGENNVLFLTPDSPLAQAFYQ